MTIAFMKDHNASLSLVEEGLQTMRLNPTPLRDEDLRPYNGKYTHGWSILYGFSDGVTRHLFILLKADFPYSAPRIAVANPIPKILSWPHLDEKGILCVLPSSSTFDVTDPFGVVKFVLIEALVLIEKSIKGENIAEFLDEFTSYWGLGHTSSILHRSLVALEPPSRIIQVRKTKISNLFSDDEKLAGRWLTRRGIKRNSHTNPITKQLIEEPYNFSPTLFSWLSSPPYPEQYPNTALELIHFLREKDPEGYELLAQLIIAGERSFDILIGTTTQNGVCAVVTSFKIKPDYTLEPKSRTVDKIQRGFRPGKVPANIALMRAMTPSTQVVRDTIERVDASWIHGRGSNIHIKMLQEKYVAIIVCGSLGSIVSRTLAQSGVGNFLLIDDDILKWENISRHQLGAQSLGLLSNKAEKLAENLEKDFPHIGLVNSRANGFKINDIPLLEELSKMDLIIDVTADWSVNIGLCHYQSLEANFPPVLYGFMEPFATVAHAILIPSKSTCCLRCGFHLDGELKLPVTKWPSNNTQFKAPGCADVFSPYGSIELSMAQALVADTALNALINIPNTAKHALWVGKQSNLVLNQGVWNPDWIKQVSDPQQGGFLQEQEWGYDNTCTICEALTHAEG